MIVVLGLSDLGSINKSWDPRILFLRSGLQTGHYIVPTVALLDLFHAQAFTGRYLAHTKHFIRWLELFLYHLWKSNKQFTGNCFFVIPKFWD